MKVELNKKDLLRMIFGTGCPTYEKMDIIPKKLGHYVGGFAEGFEWNNDCMCSVFSQEEFDEYYKEFSEEYLWDLYQKLITE